MCYNSDMRKINYILFILLLVLIVISIVSYFVFKKETVAIIGAMDVEINEIIENLNRKKQEQTGSFTITTGYLGKYKVILSKSGVGKVNAATTTQFIIDKYKPKYIINIGLAGGLSPELKAGDMVLAEKLVQHDFDLTALGYKLCEKPWQNYVYSADKTLTSKLKELYPEDIKIAFEKFENERLCLEIYEEYEEIKNRQFALDFDDLLLKTNIILENYYFTNTNEKIFI